MRSCLSALAISRHQVFSDSLPSSHQECRTTLGLKGKETEHRFTSSTIWTVALSNIPCHELFQGLTSVTDRQEHLPTPAPGSFQASSVSWFCAYVLSMLDNKHVPHNCLPKASFKNVSQEHPLRSPPRSVLQKSFPQERFRNNAGN